MFKRKHIFFGVATVLAATAFGVGQLGPNGETRYATDAYPAFDDVDAVIKPEKKTPRFFAFVNGPKKDDAASQFAWCQACELEGSASAAIKGYDALVREWPTAEEAPKAQLRLAELLFAEQDYDEAFAAYRYLLDFYSNRCDFNKVAAAMYKVAEVMRIEGKTILFFRFRNTADVRRAYEALVLRAPGAAFVPDALLTIAALREDEERLEQAITVYENLRNLYPSTPQSGTAYLREARDRMKLVKALGYNRARTRDTLDFLHLARRQAQDEAALSEVGGYIGEVEALLEDEAWKAAVFYDTRMRTKRSAVNALEKYLSEYPAGAHAEEARLRLQALKEGEAK